MLRINVNQEINFYYGAQLQTTLSSAFLEMTGDLVYRKFPDVNRIPAIMIING